jgi:hypothetical protein
LPLGPGKILINPEYIDVDRLPAILKKWDILVAPEPDPITDRMLKITSLCGKWLNMNVLKWMRSASSLIRIIQQQCVRRKNGDSIRFHAGRFRSRGLPTGIIG